MSEPYCSDCSFNQDFHAGVERKAGVRSLGEKNIERGTRKEKQQTSHEHPRQQTHCIDLDELGEWTKDSCRLESEVEAESNSNDEEPEK